MNTRLRRRLGMVDNEFYRLMSAVYRPDNICRYRSGEELLDVVGEAVIEFMYYNHFADIDDNSGEWAEIYWDMVKYVRKKYGEQIKKLYNDNCGSNKNEMKEGELTEKCWTGYTQKGMKTMFGKRYPNCVKKTKK